MEDSGMVKEGPCFGKYLVIDNGLPGIDARRETVARAERCLYFVGPAPSPETNSGKNENTYHG